jgi:hypothetical protein
MHDTKDNAKKVTNIRKVICEICGSTFFCEGLSLVSGAVAGVPRERCLKRSLKKLQAELKIVFVQASFPKKLRTD